MDRTSRPRVVIVGGGFAGLFAARALRRSPVDVTVVDRVEHHLFAPLLYQCATGILSEGQIAAPLRDVLKRHQNTECLLADVVDLDPVCRRVVAERPGGELVELPYDHLVLAAGVRQSYFGHDEYAAWAPGMKTLADALVVRAKVFGAFERAETATDPVERRRWLTFALVGAGPTGVELAGQVRELANRTLGTEFRRIRPQDARVLVFEAGRAPLMSFGPASSAKAALALDALGVELHMRSVVTHVDQDGLLVRGPSGVTTEYPAGTVLWTAGVEAPPLAAVVAQVTGTCRDRAGRLRVGPDLSVPGHPEILVAGDLMSRSGLPGLAGVAMQTGHYAGRRIRQQVAGRRSGRPFHHVNLGSAAYLARGRGVVAAGRLHLSGPVAWVMWLFLHIAVLTGFRNRLGAVLTWSMAFARGTRRERVFTSHEIDARRDVYALPGAAPRGGSP